jgi:predicted homoserine dehydrogenase-like protein
MISPEEADSGSVYHALQRRERDRNPIRVAIIGGGTTARAIALQLGTPVPGIRVIGIANRTLSRAERACREAGISRWEIVESAAATAQGIARGATVLCQDASLLTRCPDIDLVVEVTGTVDYAASVVLDAIDHGKAVVLVNAELDSLVGPVLKARAAAAGVVLTHTDGDEPGVAMTLMRYLQSVGMKPVAAGNIKGMVDYYRTPDTQQEFARRYGQDVRKVTSFADATKLSMETTVMANASGFGVSRRGMLGPACSDVREIAALLPQADMLGGGIIDYCVGAAPHTGAFVVVHEDNPLKQAQLAYYKLGDGPFYVFYTPFHLPHIQIASTIGRAILHRDATVTPLGAPVCEVVTMAKRPLKAGEKLDGVGGFFTYGLIDNHAAARATDALPMGLSEGCVLRRDLPRDAVIGFADVDLPDTRLGDRLWEEQCRRWPGALKRSAVA